MTSLSFPFSRDYLEFLHLSACSKGDKVVALACGSRSLPVSRA